MVEKANDHVLFRNKVLGRLQSENGALELKLDTHIKNFGALSATKFWNEFNKTLSLEEKAFIKRVKKEARKEFKVQLRLPSELMKIEVEEGLEKNDLFYTKEEFRAMRLRSEEEGN